MTQTQFLRNLEVPDRVVDVVLDTDTYNEIDDQFAVAYLMRVADHVDRDALFADLVRRLTENG